MINKDNDFFDRFPFLYLLDFMFCVEGLNFGMNRVVCFWRTVGMCIDFGNIQKEMVFVLQHVTKSRKCYFA